LHFWSSKLVDEHQQTMIPAKWKGIGASG